MPLISRVLRLGPVAVLAALLLGCATSSHVMIGTARPPISPESVRVYVQPPEKYEEIATLDTSSQGSFAITGQQNMDKAIARMKEEAAKLGANGILLQGVQDQQFDRCRCRGLLRYLQQGGARHRDLRAAVSFTARRDALSHASADASTDS